MLNQHPASFQLRAGLSGLQCWQFPEGAGAGSELFPALNAVEFRVFSGERAPCQRVPWLAFHPVQNVTAALTSLQVRLALLVY